MLVALLLLFTVTGNQTAVEAAVVTLVDDDVQWAAANTGDAITHIAPDTTGGFYVKDADLESTSSGTSVWPGLTTAAVVGDSWDVITGAITGTGVANANFTTTASVGNTPVSTVTATIGGTAQPFVGINATAGTFSPFVGAATGVTTTAEFTYHVVDTYSISDNRVKVSSESDPQGEWVAITEVTAAGTTSANATSQVFYGTVLLSSSSNLRGTADNGVWVQDSDLVTVTVYDGSGNIVDSNTIIVDGTAPTIAGVEPLDGTITSDKIPQVEFEVTDIASGMASANIGLSINAVNAAYTPFPMTNGFRGIFVAGDTWKTEFGVQDSIAFDMVITATDNAGNQSTSTIAVIIDEADPSLVSASTGSAQNAVTVTFTENLNPAKVSGADFTVAGAVVSSAAVVPDDTLLHENSIVAITLTGNLDTDATPAVTVVGTIEDDAKNTVTVDASVTADDGIAPGTTITIDKLLAVEADAVAVVVVTDEKSTVVASVNGATLDIEEPTPNSHEGTRTVGAVGADASGQYGVTVRASDGPNAVDNLTDVSDEAHTLAASTVVTLSNGPIADADFDGDIDGDDITVTVDGSNVTTTAVDPILRTVTLSVAATGAGLVSYSYVGSDVFEVDQSAPTVTVSPSGTIQNQSPFLRLVFDEDEYPGDSYTTVALTKAELTGPDAVVTDLLSAFVTTDSTEFLYGASDLALGAYTLKVSATDTAGNALTDNETAFTVEKRTISIGLRPGWNLISLPDAAADSAIAAVIDVAAIDIVSTFDAGARLWATAVRDGDGWIGPLTTIEAGNAYWIHTSTFDPLVVDVPGLVAGSAGLPLSFELVAGWNLVAYATSDLLVDSRDVDDYFSGVSWSRGYGYDNLTNKFSGLLPDTANVVELGKGYWIFLRAGGTLVP
jgi:hypothetical protein